MSGRAETGVRMSLCVCVCVCACARACMSLCVCVCVVQLAIMVIKATIIKFLFAQMYVNVVFVIRCLYSAVSLTLVKE